MMSEGISTENWGLNILLKDRAGFSDQTNNLLEPHSTV